MITEIDQIASAENSNSFGLASGDLQPWDSPVDGGLLLRDLAAVLSRHVVLPKHGAEALALWILHTYAFHLRNVSAYIGIESPEKRCGKTTLLGILSVLVNRPVVAANISSSAFFRVIEELRPTLLIDEADTFLQSNDELRGILNSGYTRQTAYVVRVRTTPVFGSGSAYAPGSGSAAASGGPVPGTGLASFSSWCPKVMAAIGHLPETLADRCIVLQMHRKTSAESCERFGRMDTSSLRRMCARFILDNADTIAGARPEIPAELNDRAADIWEPLFVLADLAGEPWPATAREAALALSARPSDSNPISSLLVDIFCHFLLSERNRTFSRDVVDYLNSREERPWHASTGGKRINALWLADQLRPYGIRPRALWIDGRVGKGYEKEEFHPVFKRYIAKGDLDELRRESVQPEEDGNG